MVHGYVDVWLWKAAVEKAGRFDLGKVRKAAVTLAAIASPMGLVKLASNQSLIQRAYVGQSQPDGQFKTVSQSPELINPEPYDALAFPGKTCKPA